MVYSERKPVSCKWGPTTKYNAGFNACRGETAIQIIVKGVRPSLIINFYSTTGADDYGGDFS